MNTPFFAAVALSVLPVAVAAEPIYDHDFSRKMIFKVQASSWEEFDPVLGVVDTFDQDFALTFKMTVAFGVQSEFDVDTGETEYQYDYRTTGAVRNMQTTFGTGPIPDVSVAGKEIVAEGLMAPYDHHSTLLYGRDVALDTGINVLSELATGGIRIYDDFVEERFYSFESSYSSTAPDAPSIVQTLVDGRFMRPVGGMDGAYRFAYIFDAGPGTQYYASDMTLTISDVPLPAGLAGIGALGALRRAARG